MKSFTETCGHCGNVFNSYGTDECPLCKLKQELTQLKKLISRNILSGMKSKIRTQDKINSLYEIMEAKIDKNIKSGKIKWIGPRELERKL